MRRGFSFVQSLYPLLACVVVVILVQRFLGGVFTHQVSELLKTLTAQP